MHNDIDSSNKPKNIMLLQVFFDVHGEFYCYKMLWKWKFPHALLL